MRNKVAESIFELQYIVAKWKSGKSGIFHKADDFDFLMSRGDPYYQFYKNAPYVLLIENLFNLFYSSINRKSVLLKKYENV